MVILNNAISLHVQDFILTYIFLSLNIPRREFLVSLIILGVMCEKLPAMGGRETRWVLARFSEGCAKRSSYV